MAEIRWTDESAQWLQDIYEYISADSPDAAEKVISTIYEKAQVLIEHPEIGHKYQIKESGNIDILGIFHGSLDIDRYLI